MPALSVTDKCELSEENNRKQENWKYKTISLGTKFFQCIPSGIFLGKAEAVDNLLCGWHVLSQGKQETTL